jgi:hypothetical protein
MLTFAPISLGQARKSSSFFITKPTVFVYASNGDSNGIFYFAGQNFDPAGTWTNPSTAGRTPVVRSSNDGTSDNLLVNRAATWTDLDTHSGDTSMANSAFAWLTCTLAPVPSAYRWFRILQTGTNADGDNFLALNEVELYGTLNY